MKNGKNPDPNVIYPIAEYDKEIFVKPTVKNPNIIVGDFTYIADSEFESHVTNFYPWSRDKLIIGKFCQIASGVEFVMNDANHQMNAVTTFPFYTLEGWEMNAPDPSEMTSGSSPEINPDVLCVFNDTEEDIRGRIFYGDVLSAQSLLLDLADTALQAHQENRIDLVYQIYLQVWIRSRGGLNPFFQPFHISRMLWFGAFPTFQKKWLYRA